MTTPRSQQLSDGSMLEWEVRSGLLGPYPTNFTHNGQVSSRNVGEMLQHRDGFCLAHSDVDRDEGCRQCKSLA